MIAMIPVLAVVMTPLVAQPSMSSLWPNQDGLSWEYKQTVERAAWSAVGADSSETAVRLRFDGTLIVPGGIETQNLVDEGVTPSAPGSGLTGNGALLRNLWLARPDLRNAVRDRGGPALAPEAFPWEALLIHGAPYQKTTNEIVTWRDNTEALKSWIFLVLDLTPGNTFSIQLVPDLASDVFLHGTIGGLENATVPAGSYPGCVRVDYVIDYGQAICTGEGSPDFGSYRGMTQGHVLYAPSVGPILSVEELTFTEVTGDCPGIMPNEVAARVSLALTTAPVRSEPVTWGRLKARHD
jgi:hypothetical protein